MSVSGSAGSACVAAGVAGGSSSANDVGAIAPVPAMNAAAHAAAISLRIVFVPLPAVWTELAAAPRAVSRFAARLASVLPGQARPHRILTACEEPQIKQDRADRHKDRALGDAHARDGAARG